MLDVSRENSQENKIIQFLHFLILPKKERKKPCSESSSFSWNSFIRRRHKTTFFYTETQHTARRERIKMAGSWFRSNLIYFLFPFFSNMIKCERRLNFNQLPISEHRHNDDENVECRLLINELTSSILSGDISWSDSFNFLFIFNIFFSFSSWTFF